MTEIDTVTSDDWKKAVEFHGHVCPGLAIGFKAAQAGIDWLKERRAVDEELVAIVETNACGVDAVQVLTGCTFGKGNLIHKHYGKHAFTIAARSSGLGVRLALKHGVLEMTDRHRELFDKVRSGEATEDERSEFAQAHQQRSRRVLDMKPEDLLSIEEVRLDIPPKAKIDASEPCALCGEPTMASMLKDSGDGKLVCRGCGVED